MTLEEMISNVENSIKELKDFLISEELLVKNPEAEGKLMTNQSPEAVEAYNTRRFMDVRF